MTRLTTISSRKRPSPNDHAQSGDASTCGTESAKRRRTSSPSTVSPSDLHFSTSHDNALPTPPVSAKVTATMALKLVIPKEQLSREQQKKLNRHRADAERWKPKLQRPYPNKTEIKLAYPLKLMRYYLDASKQADSNFVKPNIDRSPRVSRLLQQFPLIDTTQLFRSTKAERSPSPATHLDQAIPLSARIMELKQARDAHPELQANISITGTEHARRLAWQSFARTERGRVDRGREAMIQSGLLTDDLRMEAVGLFNGLPEWKKARTGRFAREHLVAG